MFVNHQNYQIKEEQGSISSSCTMNFLQQSIWRRDYEVKENYIIFFLKRHTVYTLLTKFISFTDLFWRRTKKSSTNITEKYTTYKCKMELSSFFTLLRPDLLINYVH